MSNKLIFCLSTFQEWTDEPTNELGIAGLNIAPRNVASGTDARADTDDDDSDDGELVVEDVTNEV